MAWGFGRKEDGFVAVPPVRRQAVPEPVWDIPARGADEPGTACLDSGRESSSPDAGGTADAELLDLLARGVTGLDGRLQGVSSVLGGITPQRLAGCSYDELSDLMDVADEAACSYEDYATAMEDAADWLRDYVGEGFSEVEGYLAGDGRGYADEYRGRPGVEVLQSALDAVAVPAAEGRRLASEQRLLVLGLAKEARTGQASLEAASATIERAMAAIG